MSTDASSTPAGIGPVPDTWSPAGPFTCPRIDVIDPTRLTGDAAPVAVPKLVYLDGQLISTDPRRPLRIHKLALGQEPAQITLSAPVVRILPGKPFRPGSLAARYPHMLTIIGPSMMGGALLEVRLGDRSYYTPRDYPPMFPAVTEGTPEEHPADPNVVLASVTLFVQRLRIGFVDLLDIDSTSEGGADDSARPAAAQP